MKEYPSIFKQLIGEDLSAVTFVRDYIQLQFNPPPTINVMTPITLDTITNKIHQSDSTFPNVIISFIGKKVTDIEYKSEEFIKFIFSDGTGLSISLQPKDYIGAEAILFWGKDNKWDVL